MSEHNEKRPPFYWNFYNQGNSCGLKITGDFRAGNLLFNVFEPMLLSLITHYPNMSFDITEVVFMDSSSMKLIRLVDNLGMEVKLPEQSMVTVRYNEYKAIKDCEIVT